jgi:hypothetical protein
LLYGEGYHIDEDGDVIERYYTEPFDYQRLSEICFICQPTVFMRAEVVRAVGPLDLDLHYCLDYEYWMRVAKRFRIGYLDEYLANSRLHTDTKTLSKRIEVHQENLQIVKKHYGRVPVRWINAYAHVFLTEKLMPKGQGIYEDGWASPRARFSLPYHCQRYRYLSLEGLCPAFAQPLPLQVAVGDQVLYKEVIEAEHFSLMVRLGPDDVPPPQTAVSEVKLYAGKSFVPDMIHSNADTRTLSYRVKKLSLIDARGRELTLYAGGRQWIFAMALPMLSLEKALVTNHRLAGKEVWQTTRELWGSLLKLPFRSPTRHC